MSSRQQMIQVPVSITDMLQGDPEDFWAAMSGHMSAWLVDAIQAALEHRRWVTTTNPIERYIRELRRRTGTMGTFQGLASCRRLVVAIRKLGDERRNAIPYSLWPSQSWTGRGRRKKSRAQCDLEALMEAFDKPFYVS